MRIDRLDLMAYGPFTGQSLNLSDGQCGLQLIYGDNEAGKSTSLRALIAWLFGIPVRLNDNYLHSNPQLRIGGKLRLSTGQEIEFIRRKGSKGTLLTIDSETTLDDSALNPFLPGGIDENLFRKLYGIDHTELVTGGEELLNQSGDLGQALFSAAIGTASLGHIVADLQQGAEDLFKPRASTRLINQAVSSFREAQKQIRELSLPVTEWKRLQEDLAGTQRAIQEVEQSLEQKSKEKSRLTRINRVKGALAEHRAVRARLAEMETIDLLPETFEDQRKTAIDTVHNALVAQERAQNKLVRLTQERQGFAVRQELIDNEKIIQDLYKQLGAVEKAIEDRPQQDGKRRQLRNEAQQLLKSVRPGLDIDEADHLRPLTNNKKWLTGLAQKYSLLSQKRRKAQVTMRDNQDDQDSIIQELNTQVQLKVDLNELKAVVAAARKDGDIETRWAKSQKRVSLEQASCEDELARLGRFSGTIDALSTTALPVPETLDRFEKRFERLAEKTRDENRLHQEIEQKLKEAEDDLRTLLLTGEVPTIQLLIEARQERDAGWKLIKEKYLHSLDVEAAIARYAREADLASVYEHKTARADQISDRLREAADQVVKRTDLENTIHRLHAHLLISNEAIEKNTNDLQTLQTEWKSIWEPLNIQAGSPREMKQWVLRVEKLLATVQGVSVFKSDAQQLLENCEAQKKSIARQISLFDSSIDTRTMSLEAMIALCEQRIDHAEASLERKRQLEHSSKEIQARMKRVREELTSIENDQNSWKQEWEQAVEGLGLKPDVHPEQATEIFDQLLVFFNKYDQSEELRRRIYGIDQVSEKFEKRLFEFADQIGLSPAGQEARTIALQLYQDLNESRSAQASLKKIVAQEKELREEIKDAEITVRAAQDQLMALRVQAGVQTDKELEPAGRRSQIKREWLREIRTLEQELSRNGDGLSIQQLEKEAGESHVDSIEGEMERVSSELQELQVKRDHLRDQRQTLQNEIQAKDGSTAATKASEDAEYHLATLASGVEQYLRLQIAALILKERIENFRKKNQAPVLARSGELFSRLTLGSFARLRDELNENNQPILLGVRPDDVEVTIDGMSDGTRDQLFLSLRIATLEQHLNQGEPMPFVVDDILIGFDDRRTRVCLEILAELALQTQVLLFTHHRRVLELASDLPSSAGIFCHELS